MTTRLLAALALAAALVARSPDEAATIDTAIEKAVAWVDALKVDPKALREERDMRGKKHLTEKLFVYFALATAERDPAKRARHVEKFKAALAPAAGAEADLHTLDESDEKRFRDDAMSYLSALYMADRLGLFDPAWKPLVAAKVLAIVKDFSSPSRASHWRMTCAFLLERLGQTPPAKLDDLAAQSALTARRPTNALSREDVYGLAREISVLAAFGEAPVRWPSADARLYAQAALPLLVQRAIREDDADLLAEILIATRDAGFDASSVYRDGWRHLLGRQNENGSFGKYERRRAELARAGSRFDVDVGGYLHTTEVAIRALLGARATLVSTSAAAAPKPR